MEATMTNMTFTLPPATLSPAQRTDRPTLCPIVYLSQIEQLRSFTLDREQADQHKALAGRWELQRMWPRTERHLVLEYQHPDGARIAGQWFARQAEFDHAFEALWRHTSVTPPVPPLPHLLLHVAGRDRKLPGLAALVDSAENKLIVHHPERRAVVRIQTAEGVAYAKIVRPEKAVDLAETMAIIHNLAGDRFATPRVTAFHRDRGVLMLSTLAGQSWHELLGSKQMVEASRLAGRTLRQLHTLPLAAPWATPLAEHGAAQEIAVLNKWLARVGLISTALQQQLLPLAAQVADVLCTGNSPSVLLHRDFYDKQLFLAPGQKVGLLDFDTLARGEAALDVANALVHLELRTLEGRCTHSQAVQAISAFLAEYAPSPEVEQRIDAYANATRLRLACVYACRPAEQTFTSKMLDLVGKPLLKKE